MPRAGLTPDGVVAAAAELADEVGLEALTLTALAERLGVRQPSLYKHLAGLPAVHRGIAVTAKRELGEVLARAAIGRSGADALRALARAYRDWAIAHPGRYAVTTRAPAPGDLDDEAASAAVVDVVARVIAPLVGTASDDPADAADAPMAPEVVHAIRTLRAVLHGFVLLEREGGFGLPTGVADSFDYAIERFAAGLAAGADGVHPG